MDSPSSTYHATYVILNSCTIPVIVVVNSVIIIIIAVFRKFHTIQNFMLSNLAAANLLYGLFTVTLKSLYDADAAFGFRDFSHILVTKKYSCIYSLVVYNFGTLSCLVHLTALTTDRYFAVAHPLTYTRIMSKETMLKCIAASWIYLIFISIQPYFWNNFQEGICRIKDTFIPEYTVVFHTGHMAILVTASTVFSALLYFKAIFKRRNKIRYSHLWSAAKRATELKRYRTTRLTMLIYVIFIAFWTPYLVVSFFIFIDNFDTEHYILGEKGSQQRIYLDYLDVITEFLLSISSFANGFLYTAVKAKFKEACKLILTTPPWRWKELKYHKFEDDNSICTVYSTNYENTTGVGVRFVVTDIPVPIHRTRGNSYEETFLSHFEEDDDDCMSDESESTGVDFRNPSQVNVVASKSTTLQDIARNSLSSRNTPFSSNIALDPEIETFRYTSKVITSCSKFNTFSSPYLSLHMMCSSDTVVL